jgi:hypothetical protein
LQHWLRCKQKAGETDPRHKISHRWLSRDLVGNVC